ncbi:MAG: nucleotidyl transferase AbiEii/AbiGii toxin family protein [Candidatus Latescibacter sp.]|nr:nucleotidyl transferase AbiEii/AbiGii toxin family protein [Candidatus Latescibacter sp.]
MFQDLIENMARMLEEKGISYMLIGGQAVLLYGEPRATKDIDVTLDVGPDRLPDIMNLVRDLDWKVLVEDPHTFVTKTLVLPCQDPQTGIRIDLIFSFSAYEHQAIRRVKRVLIGDTKVMFASVEDIIIQKVITGRPRDLEDVKIILAKNPEMDIPYIHSWLKQFSESLAQPFLKTFDEIHKYIQ